MWGVPVVVLDSIPAGTAIVGDFSAVTVKDRGNYTITWTDRGTVTELVDDGAGGTTEQDIDLFSHNLIQVRAEGRYGIEISRPTALRKIDLTAE